MTLPGGRAWNVIGCLCMTLGEMISRSRLTEVRVWTYKVRAHFVQRCTIHLFHEERETMRSFSKEDSMWAWVRYRDVPVGGASSFEEFVRRLLSKKMVILCGCATEVELCTVDEACLLLVLRVRASDASWRELLQLGLPMECIAEMAFLDASEDECCVQQEWKDALMTHPGSVFGRPPFPHWWVYRQSFACAFGG
jgi:hypothetical protein